MKKKFKSKYVVYAAGALLFSIIGAEAFAQDASTTIDAATQLTPMLNKILNSLSGTLGKVIMAVSLLLSAVAAVAGMNKAVIFTPIGVGFFLGNVKTIVEWMFGG